MSFLSVATLGSFADTLLLGHARNTEVLDSGAPTLGELLGGEPYSEGADSSRLPLRV